MRDYFLLIWLFPKDKKILTQLKNFSKELQPSSELKKSYSKNLSSIENLKQKLKANSLEYITAIDKSYPVILNTSDYAPLILSYRGDIKILENCDNLVGFVGSRRIDPELQFWFSSEVKKLDSQIVTVSGGAIGVDQFVHKESVKNNLKTLVVLPSGLFHPYPAYLFNLFKENKNFLFLSQFSPELRVYKSNFYPRNHLIASLCKKLVVLQAEQKSGTMVTARFAIDLNREIYALSSNPWDQRYSGNKELINDGAIQMMDLDLFQ